MATGIPDELQQSVRYEAVDFYAAFKDLSALQLYPSVFAAQEHAREKAVKGKLSELRARFGQLRALRVPPQLAVPPGPVTELSERAQQLERLLDYELKGASSTPHSRLMGVLSQLCPAQQPSENSSVELHLPLEQLSAQQQRWESLQQTLARAQDRLGRLMLLVAPGELSHRAAPEETLYSAGLRAVGVCQRLQDSKATNGLIALFKDCAKKVDEIFASLARRREGPEPPGESCARPEEIEGVLCALEFWARHSQSQPVVEQLLPLGRRAALLAEEGRAVAEEQLCAQLDALEGQLELNDCLLASARRSLAAAFLPLAAGVLKPL